jgi:Holliday junction resolvase
MNSRSKGARGEREAARAWTDVFGVAARRGQQFAGGTESPDVITGMAGIHVEVKRVEAGNPYVWMDQAVRDAGENAPVVLHRRNNKPWLLIVRLDDAPRLAKAIAQAAQSVGGGTVPDHVPDPGVSPPGGQDVESSGVFPIR